MFRYMCDLCCISLSKRTSGSAYVLFLSLSLSLFLSLTGLVNLSWKVMSCNLLFIDDCVVFYMSGYCIFCFVYLLNIN